MDHPALRPEGRSGEWTRLWNHAVWLQANLWIARGDASHGHGLQNFNALQSIHTDHYPKMALGTATLYLYCMELMAMCYLSKHSLPMGPAYGDFSHGA